MQFYLLFHLQPKESLVSSISARLLLHLPATGAAICNKTFFAIAGFSSFVHNWLAHLLLCRLWTAPLEEQVIHFQLARSPLEVRWMMHVIPVVLVAPLEVHWCFEVVLVWLVWLVARRLLWRCLWFGVVLHIGHLLVEILGTLLTDVKVHRWWKSIIRW